MSLPDGLSYQGVERHSSELQFIADVTYLDAKGNRHTSQGIMDQWLRTIAKAQRFILIDLFLYNDFQGPVPEYTRDMSADLTNALLRQKRRHPQMRIVVITDPVNTVYGGVTSPYFDQMRDAGIEVYVTDLTKLRDSNPTWSTFWRVFIRPFGNKTGGGISTPFDHPPASARSYMSFLNFKANHRKVLVADSGQNLAAIITSGNAHNASSAHSNVALVLDGPAAADLLHTENAVLAINDAPLIEVPNIKVQRGSGVTLQVLTESKVRDDLLRELDSLQEGDQLDIAMFFIAHRGVIRALKKASKRGVKIRILLDPNKNVFGLKRPGIPNKPVAAQLRDAGIQIRWCLPHGGQCHSKVLISHHADGRSWMTIGSTNITRRNLNDYNLETNIALRGPHSAQVFRDTDKWFQMQWGNEDKRIFSAEYETLASNTLLQNIGYLFMEGSGWSAF
ncbi:MAG: hypothetical protein JKY99_01580 [Rhizobiales bacterium]|nr:hypothetical protein [Hyphomicrobiales bacterium]